MSNYIVDLSLDSQRKSSETFKLTKNTKKFISKISNEEMKLNLTQYIASLIINQKDKKCFEEYLSDISNELISLSHKKKGISKYIFIKYFNLPFMICRRLFSVFNNNIDEEYLSAENFVENMTNLFTGNIEYLFKLIFNLFDFNNDGNISSDDVNIILSYIPIRHSNYDNKKFKFEQDEFVDRIQTQEEIAFALKLLFSSKNTISYNDFVDIIKNKNSDIFIFLLLFILERKPFTKEIIEIYKEENISEEEEESDNEDKNENILDVYIKPPTINDEKYKTPQITKKSLMISHKKTPLNMPIIVYGENISGNFPMIEEGDKKNPKKKNNILHQSKSDKNINSINEKHIKENSVIIEYKINENLSKIDFDKLELDNDAFYSLKRKPKHLNNDNKSNNYVSKNVNSYLNLKNFNLNGMNDLEDDEESNDSRKSSISLDSYNDEETTMKTNKDLDSSDNNIIKEGYFYKLSSSGNIKKILVKLINNHLFYFKNEESGHYGLDCLIRVFIKESYPREINGKYYYCFILIFKKKEKEFFIEKEEEYKNWLQTFKKILHNEDINDLYDIQNKIGEGRFAHVFKGIHKQSQRIVAIKILEKENLSSQEMDMIQNEIEILKICQHPHILKLYDVIENDEKLYIITELIEGPELYAYLEKENFDIDESIANKIIKKLTSALFYLNIFGIVHRDIKPENILLSNNSSNYNIKLIDFGLGIILGPNEKSEQPFGTVSYVSPEVLCGEKYDKSVDIWCIGILTYFMLAGKLPYDDPDDNENEIARQTINDPIPFIEEKWNIISDEAKDFVRKCLEKDPKKRINIKEILKHKWLKKYLPEAQKNLDLKLERLSSSEILKILTPNST